MYTTCVHIFQYLYKHIRYQPHPLSRLPFHAFNVVLVSCGHFISHFGQNVISSLSMPMVSNRPYSFLVNYCVYTRSHRQTRMLTRHSQNHNIILVRSYNKTMDGLVNKKKIVLSFSKKKKIVLSLGQKKNCPLILTGPILLSEKKPREMLSKHTRELCSRGCFDNISPTTTYVQRCSSICNVVVALCVISWVIISLW